MNCEGEYELDGTTTLDLGSALPSSSDLRGRKQESGWEEMEVGKFLYLGRHLDGLRTICPHVFGCDVLNLDTVNVG